MVWNYEFNFDMDAIELTLNAPLFFGIAGLTLAVIGFAVWYGVKRKNLHIWLPGYVRRASRPESDNEVGPVDIMLCVADHFEPAWNKATYEQECQRVQKWLQLYPKLASKHADADGVCPQHTFFYPEEQYRPEHLHALADLCHRGFGDVEIHLHHDQDTAEGLREKLLRFKTILHDKHGLLRANLHTGDIEYGFIHGDWALDNSNPDSTCCGVNNELAVLRETGCYADFTLPSCPSPTQTRKINSIYYATDDPLRPKSHDTGTDVSFLNPPSGDLMIVQGPLALNWKSRKWGVLPVIENGELSGDNLPTSKRIDLWIRQHICVQGRPNWIFVKLHTHGATEKNSRVLLDSSLNEMWSYLEAAYNDGMKYRLHYVSARQAYNIIKAAEAGHDGNPHEFRNFGEMHSPGDTILQLRGSPSCR